MLSLSNYLEREFTVNGTKSNRILLFDIDDTLIHTTARIGVKYKGKVYKKISNSEYNDYVLKSGEEFDYSEFDDPNILKNEEFTKYWRTLKREYHKGTHIGVITARGNMDMIFDYFKNNRIEIKKELVFAVGDPKLGLNGSIANRKAQVISKLVALGYKTFVFFDDNETNLNFAKKLEKEYKEIKIITVKV